MTVPHWTSRVSPQATPGDLASWLTEPASLTRRLQLATADFRVKLLDQAKGRSLADRPELSRRVAFRDVLLLAHDQAVIFARTEMSTAPKGRLTRWLARLGSRSLGSLLFTYPGFQRSPLEYARLDRRHALYRQAARHGDLPAAVWARRSWHQLGQQAVLVTEVFLPAITRIETQTK